MDPTSHSNIAQLTAEIVSAFVTSNKVEQGELSNLIEKVHLALVKAPSAAAEPEKPNLVPAVPIKKSVTPDYIISLEDGKKFKSLRAVTNSPQKSTAQSGDCRAIIPWSLQTMPRLAPTSPRKWASAARVALERWPARRQSRASGPPSSPPNSPRSSTTPFP